MQLQLAGGIVDPVGVDVQPTGLLAQRLDEGVADPAHAGGLVGAAGEDDLDVGAIVGGGHRDRGRGAEQAGGGDQRR
ncbi:hypothetical protein MAVA5_19085 [Mycobacterium avium subsp. hominissuis A5]|nr:hypothetical protein MAVA5_19085 [Mycobacterium avium subsp. hominissuis A5]